LNASFGNRDALASMMSGAISAAMMNITEYINEENSYIQEWKQNITSARNTLSIVHSFTALASLVGGIVCSGLGPACIPATGLSQGVTVIGEIPTYYTMNKIDTLLNDAHNRADSYLTEKGKQAKELAKFLRAIVAMNETQIAPVVFLGEMVASYVSKNIASNATKTDADVLSDLDSMSRDELDADVKTMAGMLFDDVLPPEVLKWAERSSGIRLLFFIGAGVNMYRQILGKRSFTATYTQSVFELGLFNTNNPSFNLGLALNNDLPLLEKLAGTMTYLINYKIHYNMPFTIEEIKMMGIPDEYIVECFYKVKDAEVWQPAMYQPYGNVWDHIKSSCSARVHTDLTKITTQIRNIKKVALLTNQAAIEPTVPNMVKEKWFKNTSKGMLAFTLAAAAVDGIITSVQVAQINEFIDSVVSKQTSTLETTAGVLGTWQELHTLS